uniref:Uncharacterized protein n=1 Tax=Sphaerodactylus townsendi TaxID=933632 RepID=A0ACB8ENI6_9SAUR
MPWTEPEAAVWAWGQWWVSVLQQPLPHPASTGLPLLKGLRPLPESAAWSRHIQDYHVSWFPQTPGDPPAHPASIITRTSERTGTGLQREIRCLSHAGANALRAADPGAIRRGGQVLPTGCMAEINNPSARPASGGWDAADITGVVRR